MTRYDFSDLVWHCAYAMYEGREFMGCSAGDVAEALEGLAKVLGIKGPYARLSQIAQEGRNGW